MSASLAYLAAAEKCCATSLSLIPMMHADDCPLERWRAAKFLDVCFFVQHYSLELLEALMVL